MSLQKIAAISTILGTVIAAVGLFILIQQDTKSYINLEQSSEPSWGCIKKPIQHNRDINLEKSLNYLSACYINGCYSYYLNVANFLESDISTQNMKGVDWEVGLSLLNGFKNTHVHSTVIKTRSNGKNIDEARGKSIFQLDSKIRVWLDTLDICNKGKI